MQRVEAKKLELQLLSNFKVKLRKAFLINSDAELIKVFHDCVYNMLRGNVKLSKESSAKLSKYKNDLRKFVYDKGSVNC
jgi:hypothetical protein